MKTEAARWFNYDPMRKGIYLKRIKEDMVIDKVIRSDSTIFHIRSYGFTKKNYFYGFPVFNKDSIIVRDEILIEQFDKPRESKNAQKIRQQESVLNYVLKDKLYLDNIEAKGSMDAWELEYNAQIQLQLLDRKPEGCANVSPFLLFKEKDDINEIHALITLEILNE